MRLIQGDCVEVMRSMPENSVDAIVTDPPYGLEFMGKEWDRLGDRRQPGDANYKTNDTPNGRSKVRYSLGASYKTEGANKAMQAWHEAWAREALRVLKPGGHLLAAGGTRTFHRLVCALEDAGFEIRDTIMHVYGSGFPKSANIGKHLGKLYSQEQRAHGRIPLEGTETMRRYSGHGTATKPAQEPWTLCRKPLSESSVARNVLEWGTGALNVDGCRVGTSENLNGGAYAKNGKERHDGYDNWRYKREGDAGEYEQFQ